MYRTLRALAVLSSLAIAGPTQALQPNPASQPEILTAGQWQADLDQLVEALLDDHPDPFAYVTRDDFEAAHISLQSEIPQLTDHAIMMRMAGLAGLIGDGHTRLSLPLEQAALGFNPSHSPDAAPSDPRLIFGQLPIAMESFADGIFVVDADDDHRDLIGARVEAFGSVSVETALAAAASVVSAENDGARRLLAADRLSLLPVLASAGVEAETCGVRIRLHGQGGEFDRCLGAHPGSMSASLASAAVTPFGLTSTAPAGIVVFRLDEITDDAAHPLRTAFGEAVATAEREDARLVIDLRRNTGGNNALNRAIMLAILASEEINSLGRLYVLIGPKTFSAAQSLINSLQYYTPVIFVGEPSGARPDHFGDSQRTTLYESGLILRVSSLHWSSGIGGDQRDATYPQLAVQPSGALFFAGRDEALERIAATGDISVRDLIRDGLADGRVYNAYLAALIDRLSPRQPAMTATAYLEVGAAFEADEAWLPAAYAYQIGQEAFPDDDRLEAGLARAVPHL